MLRDPAKQVEWLLRCWAQSIGWDWVTAEDVWDNGGVASGREVIGQPRTGRLGPRLVKADAELSQLVVWQLVAKSVSKVDNAHVGGARSLCNIRLYAIACLELARGRALVLYTSDAALLHVDRMFLLYEALGGSAYRKGLRISRRLMNTMCAVK